MVFNQVLLEFTGIRDDERLYRRITSEIVQCIQFSSTEIIRCISFIQQYPDDKEISVELGLEVPQSVSHDLLTGSRSLHLLITKAGPFVDVGAKKDRLYLMLMDDPISRRGKENAEIALVILDGYPCTTQSFMENEAVKVEKELGILNGDFRFDPEMIRRTKNRFHRRRTSIH